MRSEMTRLKRLLPAFVLACMSALAAAQSIRLLRDAALRSERHPDAPALARLINGSHVELMQLRGGWAQVKASGREGWLRASTLELAPPEAAATSSVESGRRAAGATAVALGVRALPPRANRHALIIGIGEYRNDPARPVATLAGVPHDIESALAMARQMQVPVDNTTVLRDRDATREGVLQALTDLDARVQPGDRVFLYWSGHGSRYFDAQANGCVEALVPHDLRDIDNREFAQWLQPLARKTDKMLVVYDACHSGGVGRANSTATRAWGAGWTPKFTSGGEACNKASNLRTRSLAGAVRALGASGQDIVHLSSSRPDEVSFDSAATGGLATWSLRQCMLRDARDLDGSGAVSIDALAACAQQKIDQAVRGAPGLEPHHLVINGNRGFVPAWFAGDPAPQATAPAPTPAPTLPTAAVPTASTPPAPAPASPPSLTNLLENVYAQRDSKRRVEVKAVSERLRIGADSLDFMVSSSHDGHVYVALLGSDEQSLTLLFPNDLDHRNRIAAGESLLLPRTGWRITAGGPAGRDRLLVLVTEGARDLSTLTGGRVGPFAQPLTDAWGRARLRWLLGTSARGDSADCQGNGCSDAFGAALLTIEEYRE